MFKKRTNFPHTRRIRHVKPWLKYYSVSEVLEI